MNPSYVLLLAFLIGVIGGLRTMTARAVVAWAANRHWLSLDNSPLALIGPLVPSLSLPWVLSVNWSSTNFLRPQTAPDFSDWLAAVCSAACLAVLSLLPGRSRSHSALFSVWPAR
jgi:hypothetical protein